MTTKLPIDLPLKSMTSKVSVAAHERLKQLADAHSARMSDVLSACILHMPEDLLADILREQTETLNKLPKVVRGMLRNVDRLTDEERALIRDMLS